jgi:hypothetical protein
MKSKIALLIGFVHVVLCGQAYDVLFIGNSFTHMNQMPKTFEKISHSMGHEIYVEMNAKSNHTLQMHCGRPELFAAIRSRKWDIVIIQPFSRELIFSADSIEKATQPYFLQLLDSISSNHACTKVMLYQTWGYKEGYKELSETADFISMNQQIAANIRMYSSRYSIPIVPVGSVWQQLLADGYGNGLYDADGSHPSPEGSYLVASVFYAAIFRQPLEGAYYGNIDKQKAQTIQRAAFSYVQEHTATCLLEEKSFIVSCPTDKFRRNRVEVIADFPHADSLRWNFGNERISKKAMQSYTFRNEGIYTITLTVFDKCGVHKYKRKVEFITPKRRDE